MSNIGTMCEMSIWFCIVVNGFNLIDMLTPPAGMSLNLATFISIILLLVLGRIDIEYFS